MLYNRGKYEVSFPLLDAHSQDRKVKILRGRQLELGQVLYIRAPPRPSSGPPSHLPCSGKKWAHTYWLPRSCEKAPPQKEAPSKHFKLCCA